MDRYVVISSDCHTVGRPEDYTPYFEAKHLDAYAEYGEHFGLDGFTSIEVQDRPVVTARYHTRWVP